MVHDVRFGGLVADPGADQGAAFTGVAALTRLAFAGTDLRPVWDGLVARLAACPADAGTAMDLAILAQLLGRQAMGLAIQAEVLARQRVFRSPCAAARPGLRLLALAGQTDLGGNTPVEFLLAGSDVQLTTLYVVPGRHLPDPIPSHDVAIVVAQADPTMDATLAEIDRLVAAWPVPVLNRPAAIARLDRDRLCHLLQSVQGLDVPITARLPRARLAAVADGTLSLRDALPDAAAYPIIARPVGSHAGLGLQLLEDRAAVARYLDERPEAAFFVSRYVDYAGADGLFRKYRIVGIDGRFHACHMAVSDQWKLWYLNADMDRNAARRREEAGFMAGFDAGFAQRHHAALEQLASRIGLDYVTVDCAETRGGSLLVFEADHVAIVHDMDPPDLFPYKPPQLRKIYAAFVSMLYRRAS